MARRTDEQPDPPVSERVQVRPRLLDRRRIIRRDLRKGDVPAERGALPGQPNVYNVAFRSNAQEPPHLNFWSDAAQAAALSHGDVSEFSVTVPWALS